MHNRILFVTNRNILTTCGELRLIKNRAEVLYSIYGVATDFITLAKSTRINATKKEVIEAGGSVQIICQSLDKPNTILMAGKRLKQELKKRICEKKYDAIVFSGPGMPAYANYAKQVDSNIKLYADVHGSSEDIMELVRDASPVNKFLKRCIFILDQYGLKKSCASIDGYFVVTEALKQYVKTRFNVKQSARYYIAPCATIDTETDYEKYPLYRTQYRKKYGIDDDTKVFIYSGGVSPWQCITETIDLYKEIHKRIPNSKLLLFSHNIETVQHLIGGFKDVVIDSFSPSELSKALCAGDFAFLLRKDCVTNNVAFPNKFLEYVQSKMKIITTPYVFEIAKQTQENDLGFLYTFDSDIDYLADYLQSAGKNPDEIVDKVLKYNSFKDRLNDFYADLCK